VLDFCHCNNNCYCALFVRHCTQKMRCSACPACCRDSVYILHLFSANKHGWMDGWMVPCDVLQWQLTNDCWFLNCNTISKFSWAGFSMLVFVLRLWTWKKIHVWPIQAVNHQSHTGLMFLAKLPLALTELSVSFLQKTVHHCFACPVKVFGNMQTLVGNFSLYVLGLYWGMNFWQNES